MKAIRFHQYGEAAILRYEDVERPVPGVGEVLVRVAGTSFNPVDATIRAGYLRQVFPVGLPHTPGIDVSGTVAEVGEGVTRFEVGDQVVGFLSMVGDGAAAEYVVAPVEVLAVAPTAIPLGDAAALPAVALTAWQSVVEHAGVRPGQRVLVNGAGGAVGGHAVQLAHQAGAEVVAVAVGRNAERVRGYGADEVVDHTAGAVADQVTGRFDAVFNFAPVPPEVMAALAGVVRDGGVLVTTTTPGPENGVRSVSVFVRSDAAQLAELVDRVDAGKLHVHVAERVALVDLADVHARGEAGALTGKSVVLA
ncbi:NADPH:quinone reductase-like Zn-dependent oxidoreductase [Saccharothrix carnea]|uniref:NADPH:quinone reductase-like Zn-dependent oxidoreductase n=1 Tax=Saccharothrix carnea TaxID=1280637 RepID=A0A2P8I0Z2_SACCR|nr:NADP-dependent oxidoreductase [Saccharothrix carnea]PSL52140.1 NADPH:quinone reductase-like Zn-dependent oxidoreductase [Saccharothrix carnea]